MWVELAGAEWSAQMHACETIYDPEPEVGEKGQGRRPEAGWPSAARFQSRT